MSKEVWYAVPEVCPDSRVRMKLSGQVDITRPREQIDIAEQCAEHYWSNGQGYECTWPLVIRLYSSEDGDALADVEVYMDLQPTFSGVRK